MSFFTWLFRQVTPERHHVAALLQGDERTTRHGMTGAIEYTSCSILWLWTSSRGTYSVNLGRVRITGRLPDYVDYRQQGCVQFILEDLADAMRLLQSVPEIRETEGRVKS